MGAPIRLSVQTDDVDQTPDELAAALEPAHALARVDDLDAELVVLCLSGRGDKDLAQVTG